MMLTLPVLYKNIGDINDPDFLERLTISTWNADAFRWIGKWIFSIIGSIVDFMDSCLMEISKIDFSEFVDLTRYSELLDKMTWIILVAAIIIAVVISNAKMDGNLEYIQWSVYIIIAIMLFGTFNDYMNSYKNVGIEVISDTFSKGNVAEKKTLSERIFYDSTYDIKASLGKNQLTTMNQNIPTWAVDINETLSKKDLQGKRVYDDNGNVTVEDLYDGVLNTGFGEERYYRYSINFLSCNLILIVCGFVTVLTMIKMAYIGFDWFYTKLYHGVIMATSVSSMNKVKIVYMTVVQSLISMLIVYAGYQIFERIITSILVADYNWLVKCILLFVGGFVTILGSSAVNKGFGLDDGTSFMLKAFMLSRALGRGAKGFERNMKRLGGAFKGGANGLSSFFDKITPHFGAGSDTDGGFQPETDPSRMIGYQEPKLLGNRDFDNDNLYGGDGLNPGYHVSDIKDQWNADLDKDVADKIARYENGNELQDDIEKRVNNLPIQEAEFTEKPLSSEPKVKPQSVDYGKYKPYSQYKKDYANGDESILNPNYQSQKASYQPQSKEYGKQLPVWFDNSEVANIPGFDEMSEAEQKYAAEHFDEYIDEIATNERQEMISRLADSYDVQDLNDMSDEEISELHTRELMNQLQKLRESRGD